MTDGKQFNALNEIFNNKILTSGESHNRDDTSYILN